MIIMVVGFGIHESSRRVIRLKVSRADESLVVTLKTKHSSRRVVGCGILQNHSIEPTIRSVLVRNDFLVVRRVPGGHAFATKIG